MENLKVHQQKILQSEYFPVVVRTYVVVVIYFISSFYFFYFSSMHFKGFNIIYNVIVIDISFSTLELNK